MDPRYIFVNVGLVRETLCRKTSWEGNFLAFCGRDMVIIIDNITLKYIKKTFETSAKCKHGECMVNAHFVS
jgi:hypothetical protein